MAEVLEYEVTVYLFHRDGSFDRSTTSTVRAYTAADAVTQTTVGLGKNATVRAVRPKESE